METIETQVCSSKRILITGILLAFLLPSVVLLADRYFLPVLHIDILSAGSFLFRDAYYGSRFAVLWLYAKRKEQRPFLLWNEKNTTQVLCSRIDDHDAWDILRALLV